MLNSQSIFKCQMITFIYFGTEPYRVVCKVKNQCICITCVHNYTYNVYTLIFSKCFVIWFVIRILYSGNNLTGVAVQFATQDQENAIQFQKCIAVLTLK